MTLNFFLQVNSLDEGFNQTLQTMLVNFVSNKKKE